LILSISFLSIPRYESQTYCIFLDPIVFGKNVIDVDSPKIAFVSCPATISWQAHITVVLECLPICNSFLKNESIINVNKKND
jgi:hypothetical protein